MDYKAIDILKSFTKEDVKEFNLFLNSPFFNTSNALIKLYQTLIKFYPDFDSKSLSEEMLYKKISPERSFNKSTIKNLFADLASAVEKYLMQINFMDREMESYDYLRNEMFKRKLGKYLSQNIKKTEVLLSHESFHDSEYFLNSIRLSTDMINDKVINQPRSNNNFLSSYVELYEKRAKYITYFFAREMVKQYYNILTIGKHLI